MTRKGRPGAGRRGGRGTFLEHTAGQVQYEFPGFRFSPGSGDLHGRLAAVKLRPQAAQTLALLLEQNGGIVSREALRRSLWPDKRIVLFETSIATVIRELRRALGDDSKSPRYIETLPRRGYRFVAPVRRIEAADQVAAAPYAPPRPHPVRKRLARGAKYLAGLSAVLVLSGAVSINPTSSSQLHPDETALIRFQPLDIHGADEVSRLVGQIIADELPAYFGSGRPANIRVVAAGDQGLPEMATLDDPPAHAYRLAGSVRREGDDLTVTVRAVGETDRLQVWGTQYRVDAGLDPALAGRVAAARIAGGIHDELVPELFPESGASVPEAARDAYRQAVEHMARRTPEDADTALALFHRAIEAAPDFAAAHAGLADVMTGWPGPPKTAENVERARTAAERALRLTPDHPDALRVLGQIHLFYDWQWQRAGYRLERAVQLAPHDARNRHALASWMSARGRHRDAQREIELAYALDPASIAISIDVMLFRYFARDFSGTIQAGRRLDTLWPGNRVAPRYTIWAHLAMGDTAAAARHAHRVLVRSGVGEKDLAMDPETESAAVLEQLWTRTARALDTDRSRKSNADPILLATMQAHLGQIPEALDQVEYAVDEQYFSYLVHPALDALRGTPRFEHLLRALGQAAMADFHETGDFARHEPK